MTCQRIFTRTLTLLGLVLGILIPTLAMLMFVQAQGPDDISITKEADQIVVAGSTATFTIVITNTGTVTMTSVTVRDALTPDCDRSFGSLLSGEDIRYTCTTAPLDHTFTNSAEVTGTFEGGGTATGVDTAVVTVIHPAVDFSKTADPAMAEAGDSVLYTIAADNTGDSDLMSVVVVEDLADCVLGSLDGDDGDDILETDETWVYTCTVVAGTEDILNTATFSAIDEAGGTVDDVASAEVSIVQPEVEIAKTPDTQVVSYGSGVTFNIAITNTGDVALSNVVVSDTQAPNCGRGSGQLPGLAPGVGTSYACTLSPVTDGFINNARVTGRIPTGQYVTDIDAAKVRLDETSTCPTDMLAYWNLDEVSGSSYDDYYNGYDGVCAGSCPTPATGRINGGQAFDGSSTGIDVPVVLGDDSFNWGSDDSFSIELWMRTSSPGACLGNNEVFVGRDDGATLLNWWVGCWDGGDPAFYLRDRYGDYEKLVGTTDLADGDWHHIVAVRDVDTGSDRALLYVDGVLEDSATESFAEFVSSTAPLNIGWIHLSHGYHFEGIIDEVALYERPLTDGEVAQHHNQGLAGRWYCQAGTYAPVIVSEPVTEATVGRLYLYDVEAVGDPVPGYGLTTYPNGMEIDTLTGLISWTPTVAQKGSHGVVVEASNSVDVDTQSFAVDVSEGTVCPADMIAYWRLDEGSGTTYYDFYDGHDGGCAGTCPDPATGYLNGAQQFDGSSTGIDVTSHTDFDWGLGDSFSIEFWMQTDSTSTCAGNEVVIGRVDGAAWWVGCEDGGAAAFYLRDTDMESEYVTGTVVTDGDWHHVVAIRDAGANQVRLYVDGAASTPVGTSYTAGFGSAAAALNIGWLDTPSRYHFSGLVDEMALYDRALSTAEIQQHHDAGAPNPGYCINPVVSIAKVANPPVSYSGDMVTYAYTVTNSGDVALADVEVSDDKCEPVNQVSGDSVLDPSEFWTFQCLTTLDEDTTNTATITGTHSLGGIVTDTHTISVDVIDPRIAIEKTADPLSIEAGEVVTYTYVVTNPGDDPLSVSVSDDKCVTVTLVSGGGIGGDVLNPGEVWTYTCSMALSMDTTNVATATATDSAGGVLAPSDTAFVDVQGAGEVYLPLILRKYHILAE